MSLFNDCVELIKTKTATAAKANDRATTAISLPEAERHHTTVPALLKNEKHLRNTVEIYYISDLHLVHHLLDKYRDGATDEQVVKYIHGIVLKLIEGDFGNAIRQFESPVVLFGGDIASSFSIAELFYRDFAQAVIDIRNQRYSELSAIFGPLEAELSTISDELGVWKSKHDWILRARKEISEYSERTVPGRIKRLFEREKQLKHDIQSKNEENGIHSWWRSDYEKACEQKHFYAIIGNHELWDFPSYDDCITAYKELFDDVNIHFVRGTEDSVFWLGEHEIPNKWITDPKTRRGKYVPLDPEKDANEYEDQEILFSNAIIVGDIGYASLNRGFNANQGIYGTALNPIQEEEHRKKWQDLLLKIYDNAQEHHCYLVVLTHMPMSDWYDGQESFSNCAFFSGHTHQNEIMIGDNGAFFYADGQVGYKKNHFRFKHVCLYHQRNPFAAMPNGYREISTKEYKEFYWFVHEAAPGTGTIEQHIRQYGGKFYVIKQDDYYAFFFITSKGTYICNGGQLLKVGSPEEIDRYCCDFADMVKAYLHFISPLRQVQERLATFVQSFGGTGRIHGTIVDIDPLNHIMVNTEDRELTFYYSPLFGVVKTYPTIDRLLQAHCPELEKRYLSNGTGLAPIYESKMESSSEQPYQFVDIKNSPYILSNKINALQRLFDRHILRNWDDDLLLAFLKAEIRTLMEHQQNGIEN